MRYRNPVVSGFYPDPSVCAANGRYYMVCSSFQYFPGVPLFESADLVNWRQIGYVLTRKSQVMLEKINSSGGVFAPTIRFCDGRFYMVTNNNTTNQNFYVYTDDIYGEWSEPIEVAQDGIDPSLYFEDGHAYFTSNGTDADGVNGVIQCEIEIGTGKKLTESRCIWHGSGGRYLESPHLYKIGGYYYLMAAEGGTEYGHMITYARSESPWGPFEGYAHNPVLTNRNKAPFLIQGIGHGDLICDGRGAWHIVCLGFRQIHLWRPYHTLGREVFLVPVRFGRDGWFTAGLDGTADYEYELAGDFTQNVKKEYTFANTDWAVDWCYLRHPELSRYDLSDGRAVLYGGCDTLDDTASPTFIAMRQKEFTFALSVDLHMGDAEEPHGTEDTKETDDSDVDGGRAKPFVPEAGVTMYACENEHYEVALRRRVQSDGSNPYEAILRLNIGGIRHVRAAAGLRTDRARLIVRGEPLQYRFYVEEDGEERYLGSGEAKYLSSEVAEGFTGVMTGLYAVGGCKAEFTEFCIRYE